MHNLATGDAHQDLCGAGDIKLRDVGTDKKTDMNLVCHFAPPAAGR